MTVEFDQDIYTIDFTDPANGNFAIQPFTTNGPLSPTSVSLAPGAVTASTTLTLVGRGLPGWGESIIENMVHMLENFAGPTEPTFQIPGQMWFDTTNTPNDVLKVRNQANDAWNNVLTVGVDLDFGGFKGINLADATDPTDAMNQQSSDARYVKLTGDAMNAGADLIFSGSGEVLGLPATPSVGSAAASKTYVDVTFVDAAGDTMAGTLNMGTNFITNVVDPVNLQDTATKNYVDTEIVSTGGTLFVNVAGDTMAGFLILSGDPTINFHAATKQYVDSVAGAAVGDGVVDSGLYDSGTNNGQITLTRTLALSDIVITGLNTHPHTALDVTYQAVNGERLDNVAPERFPSYDQDFANTQFDEAAQVVASRNKRQFITGVTLTTLPLSFSYPAETNRLQVFLRVPSFDYGAGASAAPIGGRKLVADERGVSEIVFSAPSTFPSSSTGLSDDATIFTFTVDVDGGGPTVVSIVGSDAQIYGDNLTTVSPNGLIDAINAEFISSVIPAIATFEDSAILIFSDTTGSGSSVVVADTGLFAALTSSFAISNIAGVTHDYSEDGPALADSTSITLPGVSAATDEFEIIRIK
jgi:hypothetical protein